MTKTPPGNALAGLVTQQGDSPATSSGNHRPLQNALATAAPTSAALGGDKATQNAGGAASSPSLIKTIVPWLFLALFLIAAIGVLILAIAK
jgi:hypothetical protein